MDMESSGRLNSGEAKSLGREIAVRLREGEQSASLDLLSPVLAQRTPFPILERLGEAIGTSPVDRIDPFLDALAALETEGEWVVIGAALAQRLDRDLAGALGRCRGYVIAADVWYGADILGERVPGPALVRDFDRALAELSPWREDANHWVRRAVGVAVHFWAKRSGGSEELTSRAGDLLAFLEPMFGEWELPAAKGIGWGLKTLGKHYPDLMVGWLPDQLNRRHRAVVARKAMTYLAEGERSRLNASYRS